MVVVWKMWVVYKSWFLGDFKFFKQKMLL
jgi:hypothetical protein